MTLHRAGARVGPGARARRALVVGACVTSAAVVLGAMLRFGVLALVPTLVLLIAAGAMAWIPLRRGASYVDPKVAVLWFWAGITFLGAASGFLMVAVGNWGGVLLVGGFSYGAYVWMRSLGSTAIRASHSCDGLLFVMADLHRVRVEWWQFEGVYVREAAGFLNGRAIDLALRGHELRAVAIGGLSGGDKLLQEIEARMPGPLARLEEAPRL